MADIKKIQRPAVIPATEESKLKQRVMAEVAKNIGVPTTSLPPSLETLVEERVETALNHNVTDLVSNIIDRFIPESVLKQTNLSQLINNRLKEALSGLQRVRQNEDALKIMQENAQLLKNKYDAYVTAGFTAEQSFELILAEMGKPRRQPA